MNRGVRAREVQPKLEVPQPKVHWHVHKGGLYYKIILISNQDGILPSGNNRLAQSVNKTALCYSCCYFLVKHFTALTVVQAGMSDSPSASIWVSIKIYHWSIKVVTQPLLRVTHTRIKQCHYSRMAC